MLSFDKRNIYSTEICGNILNIFGVRLKPPTLLYKINLYTLIYIVLLDILLCVRLCLVLVISDIGFIEDKASRIWYIYNGGDVIYHYHYIFDI